MFGFRLIFSGLLYLYVPTTAENFKKNPWDKDDMIQKFQIIWHGINLIKTWFLQIQTTTEKIKLIRYLILGELKFWNLKNEHFEKKRSKSENT